MSFPSTVPGTSSLGYMGTKVARPIALVDQSRDPQLSDARAYDLGTIWINHLTNNAWILTSKPGNVAFWLPFVGGSLGVISLTSDTGPTFPVLGNINLLGSSGLTTSTAGNTITLDNLRDLSPYVVNIAGGSEFTSIQAAINQSVSDGHDETNPANVFIYPGTYAENVVLASGVYLQGLSNGRGFISTVVISGSVTANAVGFNQFSIQNIEVNAPTGNALILTGTAPMRFFGSNLNIVAGDTNAWGVDFNCNSGTFGLCLLQDSNVFGDDFGINVQFHNAIALLFTDVNANNLAGVNLSGDCRLTSRVSQMSPGLIFSNVSTAEIDYSGVNGQVLLNDTTAVEMTYTSIVAGGVEAISIAPGSTCTAIANIVESDAASGFWCTGTGTIATGGNNTLTGTAGLIDPALIITGFGAG